MFSDRLNLLMIQLNASGAQIAKYAGFDRTNVSRLRSGARIPVSGGPTAEKLISGIYLFADSNNSLPVLCEITKQPLSASAEEIMAGLSDWLFGGEEKQSPRPERPKKAAACRTFGERLDAAMSLAELSNIPPRQPGNDLPPGGCPLEPHPEKQEKDRARPYDALPGSRDR